MLVSLQPQGLEPVLKAEYDSGRDLRAAVLGRIQELQTEGRGNKAVSINTYLRCLKAFLHWCFEERIFKEPVKLSWLKEEQTILATFSAAHVKAIIGYKPQTLTERRLHTLVCLLLDTGVRVAEALALSPEDVDFDNLVLRVKGKGGKHRMVPFSVEFRKLAWRYLNSTNPTSTKLFFCSRNFTPLRQRDVLRDFKELAERLGITGVRVSPHTCRHTFAVSYLRGGGNLFYLCRILGHSSITTTQRYLQSLGVDDLKAVHNGLSPISR